MSKTHLIALKAFRLCELKMLYLKKWKNKEKSMESYKYVRPEYMNHYGFLFGGNLLKWVDETAGIAASMEYPGCNFVTVGMDKVEFKKSVRQGAILRFNIQRHAEGRTSVTYTADVYARDYQGHTEELVFSTHITFVCVDNCGKKIAITERENTSCPLGQYAES
jgi:acyl-CoA hydrolase